MVVSREAMSVETSGFTGSESTRPPLLRAFPRPSPACGPGLVLPSSRGGSVGDADPWPPEGSGPPRHTRRSCMSTEAHPGRTETAGPAPDPRSATSVSDADLAARLVVDAGTLARLLREGGLDVSRTTTISDVLTEADTAAERRITDLLAHHPPEDGVLGEEGTLVPGRHDRRWVVVPVDGTDNFVAGS